MEQGMKVIDLSHAINERMPVFPGSEKPQLTTVATYEKDGYRETLIRMYSHVGTHIDPPAHVYEKGLTLDALPLTQFIGQALVWHDKEALRVLKPDYRVGPSALEVTAPIYARVKGMPELDKKRFLP